MVLIQDNSSVLAIGALLPPFRLPSTGGTVIDSQTMEAGVLVIVFTCNHCRYARAYEDRLIELQTRFDVKDVKFILISSNDPTGYPEDTFDEMRKRHDEKKYPFPYCLDESQDIAKAFGALCTPHCFVFDVKHALQYKGRVDNNWQDPAAVTSNDLRDAILAVAEGKRPKIQEANAIGCSIKWRG